MTQPPAPVAGIKGKPKKLAPDKKPAEDKRYEVIRDSREHAGKGWSWPSSASCKGTINRKLDTGDYSLVGYEEVFTVDRKGHVSEFAKNLFEARFARELDRMATFKLAVILLEFEFEDLMSWPASSGIPAAKRRYMKITRDILLAKFWQLKLKYPHVEFLFAGPCGKWAMSSLFKRVCEAYGPAKVA